MAQTVDASKQGTKRKTSPGLIMRFRVIENLLDLCLVAATCLAVALISWLVLLSS